MAHRKGLGMEREIRIDDLFKLYLSKWPVLLVSFIAMAILAFVWSSYFVTPLYVSTGSIYITSQNPTAVEKDIRETVNLTDLVLAQELAKSYEAILSSNTFLKAVAEECGYDYDYKALKKMIQITRIEETEIMFVRSVNPDPVIAQKIANTVIDLAPAEIERIIYGGQVTAIDLAEAPEEPSSPNIMKNTVVGALVGAFLAAAVIFIVDLFDKKIKSMEVLEKVADLPVLGSVPEMVDK